MRDLAVVVPAHNEARLLPGLLHALAAQSDQDFTLVIVDNASTDTTATIAAGYPFPTSPHPPAEPISPTQPAIPITPVPSLRRSAPATTASPTWAASPIAPESPTLRAAPAAPHSHPRPAAPSLIAPAFADLSVSPSGLASCTGRVEVVVLREPEPGAGTAADTGFRYAISLGATKLLRTDADCLPARDWVATGRALLDRAEMVCGRSVPRRDENPTWAQRYLYPAAVRLAALAGRRLHRSPTARAPFVLIHGHNMGITADLYTRCGGTPREDLSAGSEDVTLLNRAREHSDRVRRTENLVVEASLRRLRAWGPWRTLLWSWNRRYTPGPGKVHVR
ncbi:glycosyltransferase [Actinoplanes sp. NPDC051494]|uniref:glycosyltransferase family 2 protein n=1 Tax=Actinoplanes sp. NPDC051494 TaxID=3363907 RepID=UPI0037A1CFD2